MPNEAIPTTPQMISLSSHELNETEVNQPDNSFSILIPLTQPNNTTEYGYHMIIHSKYGIFKSCQIFYLRAIKSSPPNPTKPTSITKAQKSSH